VLLHDEFDHPSFLSSVHAAAAASLPHNFVQEHVSRGNGIVSILIGFVCLRVCHIVKVPTRVLVTSWCATV